MGSRRGSGRGAGRGTSRAPDGGWGWVVCVACLLLHLLEDGLFYSFGVLYVELLDYFGESKGNTAWIVSLPPGVCLFSGPFAALLTDKYGCRAVVISGSLLTCASLIVSMFAPNIYFLYLTLGVLSGLGYGMMYLPSIVCVLKYFDKRRSLATGLGVSGSGIGTFIFSPISSWLINEYTWKGCLLIEAGILLNCVAVGLVYLPLEDSSLDTGNSIPEEETIAIYDASDTSPGQIYGSVSEQTTTTILGQSFKGKYIDNGFDQNEHITDVNTLDKSLSHEEMTTKQGENLSICATINQGLALFRYLPYTLFAVSTFLYSLFYLFPYFYLPDTAVEAGIDEFKASWLVSSVGLTNTLGRVLFGFISDLKCVNKLYLFNIVLMVAGLATTVGNLFPTFEWLMAYSVVFGLTAGIQASQMSVILSDIVGIDNVTFAFGLSNFFSGIGCFIGPPIAGWLFDVTGAYTASYITSGVVIASSGAILFLLPYLKKRSTYSPFEAQ